MFKVILIATDLSDTSDHALDVAAQLASEHGSVLHLAHVIRDPATEPWAMEAFGADFGALLDETRSRAKRALMVRADRLRLPDGVQSEVAVGAPAEEIVRYAKAIAADLIVVGSHGRTSMQRVFLGSVADRVLRHAACPVLVVRPAPSTQTAIHQAAEPDATSVGVPAGR
jgi:nucleotide-binding universal stress UspA family protein